MNIPLSPRLAACASFVPQGARVADIGCDHGYLSLHLLHIGRVSYVYAADINEGPLQSALGNAEKFGYQNKMSFYLSDGVRNIPQDFDCMICAGMGADTIISILEAAPWLRTGHYSLILQCQSKTPELRKYLSQAGWSLQEEKVLRDGKFLYTIMEVSWAPEAPRLTLGQCYYPCVLQDTQEKEYYAYVIQGLKIATEHRQDAEKRQALKELEALPDTFGLQFLREERK